MYVVKINKENNSIVVGKKDSLKSKQIKIHQINWLGKKSFLKNKVYKNLNIKVRARQEPIKGNHIKRTQEADNSERK